MMEGRETDLEYNLLMGLTGASVSKHLLDEHFTLLWANDFYYDMIGYPKEEYEALFHNKPDLYFKGYDEAWNILSKNVYETIAPVSPINKLYSRSVSRPSIVCLFILSYKSKNYKRYP